MYAFEKLLSKHRRVFGLYKKIYTFLDTIRFFLIAYVAISVGILLLYAASVFLNGINIIPYFADKMIQVSEYEYSIYAGIHSPFGLDFITLEYMRITTPLILAFVATSIRLLILLFRKKGDEVIKMIVSKYPSLDEMLQTAHDNRHIKNVIMNALSENTYTNLRSVKPLSMFRMGPILSIIIVSALFAGVALYIPSTDMVNEFVGEQLDSAKENPFIDKLTGAGDSQELRDILEEELKFGTSDTEDIYGEMSIAKLEGTEIDLTLYSSEGVERGTSTESTTRQFSSDTGYPVDIVSGETGVDEYPDLSQSQKDIIAKFAIENSQ